MNELIIAHCRENPQGVSSGDIAGNFLKFKGADPRLAHIAVHAILAKDRRFELGPDGLWRVVAPAVAQESARLRDLPWAATVILAQGNRVMHVSIWSVFPEPKPVLNEWLIDPQTLDPEEQDTLRHPGDVAFSAERLETVAGLIAVNISAARPLFTLSLQQALLARYCVCFGEVLSDDFLTVGTLLQAAEVVPPRPMDVHVLSRVLDVRGPGAPAARENGRILAECTAELITRLEQMGIETQRQLEESETRQVQAFDFSGKQFSCDDLNGLPSAPGVYGFINKTGETIYVGKATNLRRRVMSYFRRSDESPEKLEKLREQAHSFVAHRCGSELESLLYEHRLILKHNPPLNTQIAVNERKGAFKTVGDSIILLPHADNGKGMSVWFRNGQKIQMRSFNTDFTGTESLAKELEEFFFCTRLPAAVTDFPEQEIAQRWIKRHADSLIIVPAGGMTGGEEILRAMQTYWSDGPVGRIR